MRDIRKIVIHCSDSPYGERDLIEGWHLDRGWQSIGYHYVILNGRIEGSYDYQADKDGTIQLGRDLDDDGDVDEHAGAHAFGLNPTSLGVCLIGPAFTPHQIRVAHGVAAGLVERYGLEVDDVIGHKETPHERAKPARERKTCPELDMGAFRRNVQDVIVGIGIAKDISEGLGSDG